jgi:hypothetical protein
VNQGTHGARYNPDGYEFDKNSLLGIMSILGRQLCVKGIIAQCGSKVEMSPLTAKLKCPYGRGKDNNESEANTEIPGDEFG